MPQKKRENVQGEGQRTYKEGNLYQANIYFRSRKVVAAPKTTHLVTGNITQSLYIQFEWVCYCNLQPSTAGTNKINKVCSLPDDLSCNNRHCNQLKSD